MNLEFLWYVFVKIIFKIMTNYCWYLLKCFKQYYESQSEFDNILNVERFKIEFNHEIKAHKIEN